jgi:hypothetical protein
MSDLTEFVPIFDAAGDPVGFRRYRWVFDAEGTPVGQLKGSHVYALSGKYVGELEDDMVLDKGLRYPDVSQPGAPQSPGRIGSIKNRGARETEHKDAFSQLLV